MNTNNDTADKISETERKKAFIRRLPILEQMVEMENIDAISLVPFGVDILDKTSGYNPNDCPCLKRFTIICSESTQRNTQLGKKDIDRVWFSPFRIFSAKKTICLAETINDALLRAEASWGQATRIAYIITVFPSNVKKDNGRKRVVISKLPADWKIQYEAHLRQIETIEEESLASVGEELAKL